jgi:hypothetical protein
MCIRVQNYSCDTKISKLDLGHLELCDECINFVNNVYLHFVPIIWIFYVRFVDTKYIIIGIFINFGQNLDIITIIVFQFCNVKLNCA